MVVDLSFLGRYSSCYRPPPRPRLILLPPVSDSQQYSSSSQSRSRISDDEDNIGNINAQDQAPRRRWLDGKTAEP